SNAIIANAVLIQKVYFPRLLLPAAGALAGLVDFVVRLVITGVLLAVTGTAVTPRGVAIVAVMALVVVLTGVAGAVTTAAIVIKYRDMRPLLPFMLEVAKYLTP